MTAITAVTDTGKRKWGHGAGEEQTGSTLTDLDIMCNGFISPLQLPHWNGSPRESGHPSESPAQCKLHKHLWHVLVHGYVL